MQHNILAKMLQFTIVIVLCGFATSSVFGQMTPITYSDVWVDTNGTLYGSGVTDEGYNSYNHQAGVVATLTSPNSRVASYDTGYSGSYACSTVSLTFDISDVGQFNLVSDYYDYCPIILAQVSYGSGGDSATAATGYSKTWWQRQPPQQGSCYYNLETGCVATCHKTNPWGRLCGDAWSEQFWDYGTILGYKICGPSPVSLSWDDFPTRGITPCGDF